MYFVLLFTGLYLQNKLEDMLANAIQAEVDAWNWSQPFVQAKFKKAERVHSNSISISEGTVPAHLKFIYRPPTQGREVKISPLAINSAASHI